MATRARSLRRSMSRVHDQDSPLDRETEACIKELRTAKRVSGSELVRLIARNEKACEELAASAAAAQLPEQLRDLLEEEGALQGDPGSAAATLVSRGAPAGVDEERRTSVFGDVLSVFGFGEAKPEKVQVSPRPDAEAVARFDQSLALLARYEVSALPRCVTAAEQTLTELDELSLRLAQLRETFPRSRESILVARQRMSPLPVQSLVNTFREAQGWRGAFQAALSRCQRAKVFLQAALEEHRAKVRERRCWRSLSRVALLGLDRTTAARASAELWLHGDGCRDGADLVTGSAALRQCHAAAADLDRRLVRCAGAAMRAEPRAEVVRMTTLRVRHIRDELRESGATCEAAWDSAPDKEEAALALRSFLTDLADVAALLREPAPGGAWRGSVLRPRSSDRGLGAVSPQPPRMLALGAGGAADAEDQAELRIWIRDVLLAHGRWTSPAGGAESDESEAI